MSAALTEAEELLLRWLVEQHGREGTFRGGMLVDYYEWRAREKLAPEDRWMAGHETTGRRHAWRRTGGMMLGRIGAKGYLRPAGANWGTQLWALTEKGLGRARDW